MAEDFADHKKNIASIEQQIQALDKELAKNTAKKKTLRDTQKTEDLLQRIIQIQGEIISQKKDLDLEIQHVKAEHHEEGKAMNMFAEVKQRTDSKRRKDRSSPLQIQMSGLFQKIRSKYSSFIVEEEGSEELEAVEKVVKTQAGKRRAKEAEVYLRKKSEIKLVK